MKLILIDEQFHEREVNFKIIPEVNSMIEIEKDKKTGRRSRYKIISGGSRNLKNKIIPILYLKWMEDHAN